MNLRAIICLLTRRHKLRYRQVGAADGGYRQAYCTRCGLTRPVKRRKEKPT